MCFWCGVSSEVGGSCRVTLDTTIVGIGGETRGAEFTDSFVIFNYTGSVPRTGGAFARVLALVSDTCLASGAPSVLQADRDLGVAARGADTHSLVLQHLALLQDIYLTKQRPHQK